MDEKNSEGQDRPHLSATEDMCKFCFDVLIGTLFHQNNVTNLDEGLESIPATAQCPLFVTWDKLNGEEYHLRGCIGTLAPLQLRYALGDYARTSALRDPRFRPIAVHEIPKLRVSVSLLVNYEDCENCLDWEVGVHGIIINFSCDSKNYSATFLPEVAAEQRWNQQETIKSLVYKAGYRKGLTHDVQKIIRCTRYQSSKHRLVYEKYVTLENAVPVESENNETTLPSSKKNWRNAFNI